MKETLTFFVLVFLFFFFAHYARAEFKSPQVIVKFKETDSTTSKEPKNKNLKISSQRKLFPTRPESRAQRDHDAIASIEIISAKEGNAIKDLLDEYKSRPEVEWVVEDAPVKLFSSDTLFSQQWPLSSTVDHDIDAPEAWNITKGSSGITLAEIDSGVDRNHPDLKDNIFINTAEIPGNNSDDDNNGYIDDVYGWNFLQNNNDTFDTDSHGTHVAGLIAAKSNNNLGIAGVSQSKVLPLRIFTSGGVDEHTSDVLRALQYVSDNAQRFNIKAVNMSFGASRTRTDENATDVCVAYEPVLKNLYSKGVTAVAAAGNGASNKPWEPNTGIPFYNLAPAGCYGVISVGATDTNDNLAQFSNYGPNMVVSAPGSSYPYIISTCPGSGDYQYAYCNKIGTSMAAPHVVGTLGLMYSVNPNLNHWTSRSIFSTPANYGPEDRILNSSPSLYGGAGRLNAYKAVLAAQAASTATEPSTMTVRDQDIIMSFGVSAYSAYPNIKVMVIDEGTGRSVNGAQVVLTLRAPDGQIKQFSGFTETQDAQDPTKWYASFTAYLSTNTLNALQGNYTVTILSVAGNTNMYRPSVTNKTFNSSPALSTPTMTPTINQPTPTPMIKPDTIGIYRPSNSVFYLRKTNTSGPADVVVAYGVSGDVPLTGDWDGNGTSTPGVFRNGTFYLRNSLTSGTADTTFGFGMTGDIPVAGDWDGDGKASAGIFRSGVFYLRNSLSSGNPDYVVAFGTTGDQPITGDWNSDGKDEIGVYRSGSFYLRNTLTSGAADTVFNYGMTGDKPIIGDWNADKKDTVGIVRNGAFYLKNTNASGIADSVFAYGLSTDLPQAGKW